MRALNEKFMKNTPINRQTVSNAIVTSGITDLGSASIREIVKLVNVLRRETGVEFIRMEMGIPGLPPLQVGAAGRAGSVGVVGCTVVGALKPPPPPPRPDRPPPPLFPPIISPYSNYYHKETSGQVTSPLSRLVS